MFSFTVTADFLLMKMTSHCLIFCFIFNSQVLVTTNVLARGVDVPAVAVVVNYDLPKQRIGG